LKEELISELEPFSESSLDIENLENKPFQYNELILMTQSTKTNKISKKSNRLIQLKPNSIEYGRTLEIFHDHIIAKSKIEKKSNITFKFMNSLTLNFKRPSLFEFLRLKNQETGVSSHFSILTLVPFLLNVGQNCRVLEAGTGSGCMSLCLSERLGTDGILHSFDVNPKSTINARQDFNKWRQSFNISNESNPWPDNVKFNHSNILETELSERFNDFYDAIYLDMSALDLAIHKVYRLLKPGGLIVINGMHLTQIIKCLKMIDTNKIPLVNESILQPNNIFWDCHKISVSDDYTCREEDKLLQKNKHGGLLFNYWPGFLAKFRKI
jgi:predicted O-methyltransferase YrrM